MYRLGVAGATKVKPLILSQNFGRLRIESGANCPLAERIIANAYPIAIQPGQYVQGLVNQKNPYLQLSDIESVEGLSPEFISRRKPVPKESPLQLLLDEGTKPVRKTRRRRGTHSTACLCPEPSWYRPDNFKAPRQLGHAYNRLVRRDRKTGALSLRMRISRHPYFVQLREQAGRQRDFRPEREKLLDAIVPLWSAPLTGLPILTLSTSVKWRGSSAKRTAKERDPESDGTAGLPPAAAHDGIRVTGAA